MSVPCADAREMPTGRLPKILEPTGILVSAIKMRTNALSNELRRLRTRAVVLHVLAHPGVVRSPAAVEEARRLGVSSGAFYGEIRNLDPEGLVTRTRGQCTLTTAGVKAGPEAMREYRRTMQARGKEVEPLRPRVLVTTGMLREAGHELPPGLGPGTFDVAHRRFWSPDSAKVDAVAARCQSFHDLEGVPFVLSQCSDNLGARGSKPGVWG